MPLIRTILLVLGDLTMARKPCLKTRKARPRARQFKII